MLADATMKHRTIGLLQAADALGLELPVCLEKCPAFWK
jgi:hypothetical protein